MTIYLDHNATAPLRPEAWLRMAEAMELPANPSSVHAYGRRAKHILEESRRLIAEVLSAWPDEVVFLSSGTEANNTALLSQPGRRVLASAIEHSSVWKPVLEMDDYGLIPVDDEGVVRLEALETLLRRGDQPTLVSVMLANNETGVIQPVREIRDMAHRYGARVHCDAVQGLGKIPVDFGALGVDYLSVSAHKCGGPVGAAALLVRRDAPFSPLVRGGGQESGRRAGTENVPALAGFAQAVQLAGDTALMRRLRGWLDAMECEVMRLSPQSRIFGKTALRLPNTSCLTMPGVGSEVQLMHFDLAGIAVSAGSACSSGRVEPSHVLSAMGVPQADIGAAIRISGGWNTQETDVLAFATEWKRLYASLREKRSACANAVYTSSSAGFST